MVSLRRQRAASSLLLVLVAFPLPACRSQQQVVAEQQKALTSLQATTRALGDAWLSGAVSGTYVRTALEATQQRVEKQRSELAASPDMLANPVAASLSDAEDQLARRLALLWKAVGESDAGAVRQQLSGIASSPAAQP